MLPTGGRWRWADGSRVPLPSDPWSEWYPGEPNQAADTETCAVLTNYKFWAVRKVSFDAFYWVDFECDANSQRVQGYICERSLMLLILTPLYTYMTPIALSTLLYQMLSLVILCLSCLQNIIPCHIVYILCLQNIVPVIMYLLCLQNIVPCYSVPLVSTEHCPCYHVPPVSTEHCHLL